MNGPHHPFDLAYRLAELAHRVRSLEASLASLKRHLLRILFFVALWAAAILSNYSSLELSKLLKVVVTSGSQMF